LFPIPKSPSADLAAFLHKKSDLERNIDNLKIQNKFADTQNAVERIFELEKLEN
jgi:hypothetical protein